MRPQDTTSDAKHFKQLLFSGLEDSLQNFKVEEDEANQCHTVWNSVRDQNMEGVQASHNNLEAGTLCFECEIDSNMTDVLYGRAEEPLASNSVTEGSDEDNSCLGKNTLDAVSVSEPISNHSQPKNLSNESSLSDDGPMTMYAGQSTGESESKISEAMQNFRLDRIRSETSMMSNLSDCTTVQEESPSKAADIAAAENMQQLKDTNCAIEAAARQQAMSALAEAAGEDPMICIFALSLYAATSKSPDLSCNLFEAVCDVLQSNLQLYKTTSMYIIRCVCYVLTNPCACAIHMCRLPCSSMESLLADACCFSF
jgi:hypothetical protein